MPRFDPSAHGRAAAPDPHLESLLRYLVALGAMLVLLLPEARGSYAALGLLPLWLLAMPLTAWWALHRFALPAWVAPARSAALARPRARAVVQARRRSRPVAARAQPRAA